MIPILFGMIAGSSGYTLAFLFGGIASIVFALLGFAAREPVHDARPTAQPGEEQPMLSDEYVH